MKKTKNILMAEYVISVIISLMIVILFETDLFADLKGLYTGSKQEEFILLTVMELVTVSVIPLSLKIMKIKRIKSYLTSDSALAPEHLLKIGSFRMFMLALPLVANILLYYLYWQTTFGYMAIILFFCLFFIYPSSGRCESETAAEN